MLSASRILVVDDDPHLRRATVRILKAAGYQILEAANGQAALELAGEFVPDLILLDVVMPDMDGIHVYQHLKEKAALGDSFVVFLSGSRTASDEQAAGLESGADGYIARPIANRELLARVETFLRLQRTEKALRQSEENARAILNATTDIALLIEADGTILIGNQALAQFAGVASEDLEGLNVYDFFPSELAAARRAQAERVLVSGEVLRYEEHLPVTGETTYNNIYPVFGATGQVERLAIFAQDIQALKQAEAQLKDYAEHLEQTVAEKMHQLEIEHAKAVQMDKLASLGEMATGVAHELTQPLAAISFDADYLRLVSQKVQDEPLTMGALTSSVLDVAELHKIGENIGQDVQRCRRIIDHLREFGRTAQGQVTQVDLNRAIEDSFILVGQRLKNHNVSVHLDLAENLPLIRADVHKLEQVFLNLISNAEYALEKRAERHTSHNYQKKLCISTTCEHSWVVVEVFDNGHGIPDELKPRVFEPFFTTKPVGSGTGLGLSISYSIVTEFGGEMMFQSELGVGTTFILRFPVHINAGD